MKPSVIRYNLEIVLWARILHIIAMQVVPNGVPLSKTTTNSLCHISIMWIWLSSHICYESKSILLDHLSRLELEPLFGGGFSPIRKVGSREWGWGAVAQLLGLRVPQGSILSLMFFNIYMKPLDEVIRRSGLGCHQQADVPQTGAWKQFEERQEELKSCHSVLTKREVLLVGGKTDLLFWMVLHFPLKKQICSLGVLLDLWLVLDKQVSQLWHCLSKKDLATVVYALVTPGVDYCHAGWSFKSVPRGGVSQRYNLYRMMQKEGLCGL